MRETGLETLEPDRYLGPRRYRITFCCERCGHEWKKVVTKLDGKDPPCPVEACRDAAIEADIMERAERMAKMLFEQRAPAQIGNNVQNRAIDVTADVVMSDYGLTDLKDNIRPGEAMAPKLPGVMQQQADGFFGASGGIPQDQTNTQAGRRRAAMLNRLARGAINGQFRATALNPDAVVGGQKGEAPLRMIGTEKLR